MAFFRYRIVQYDDYFEVEQESWFSWKPVESGDSFLWFKTFEEAKEAVDKLLGPAKKVVWEQS